MEILIGVAWVLAGVTVGFLWGYWEGQRIFARRAWQLLCRAEESLRQRGGFEAAVELAGWQAAIRWYHRTFLARENGS